PEMLALFKKKVTHLLAKKRAHQQPETERLKAQLAKETKEIENIMQAIRAGILTETTKAELERAEAVKRELEQELAMRTLGLERITTFLPRAVDRFGELVRNLEAVAQQDVARARTHVAALLGGKIKLEPAEDGFLDAELAGDYTAAVRLAGQV